MTIFPIDNFENAYFLFRASHSQFHFSIDWIFQVEQECATRKSSSIWKNDNLNENFTNTNTHFQNC